MIGVAMQYQRRFPAMNIPPALRFLLMGIAGMSVFSALFSIVMPRSLSFLHPLTWLSLNSIGVAKHFFWQIVTYPFVMPINNLGSIINLLFSLYLLFSIGVSICATRGQKALMHLFFGGTIAGGIAATVAMHFFPGISVIAGPMAAMYAVLLAWTFLFPDAEIYIFMSIPMRASWMVVGFAGITMFADLSEQQYARFFANAGGLLFGYFYAVFAWNLHSPYRSLRNFERHLNTLKTSLFPGNVSVHDFSKGAKIYDIRTGKAVLDDEAFLDACLEKISRLGKGSLSFWERIRMNQIRKRRARAK